MGYHSRQQFDRQTQLNSENTLCSLATANTVYVDGWQHLVVHFRSVFLSVFCPVL